MRLDFEIFLITHGAFFLLRLKMSYPFLETLFHTYQSQIENKDDALIIFIHWCLISHGFQRLNGNQVEYLLLIVIN